MAADLRIRSFVDQDLDAIIRLSLLAWEPVFRSFRRVLGPNIYPRLYPDWHKSQEAAVQSTCEDRERFRVIVSELDNQLVGFLAYELKGDTGEVVLLAVHPDYQDQGIGTKLNLAALEQMTTAGMTLSEVGTGGEEGHAPARRSYEKVGYTALPLVRYYRAL